MSRLVAISNRVSLPRKGASSGGLAVGVLAAMRAHGGLWIGWSGEVAAGQPGGIDSTRRERLAFATFDLSRAEHEGYYLGFSNRFSVVSDKRVSLDVTLNYKQSETAVSQ